MASSQNRFVLPDSSIVVNLFKYEKALCSLYKSKKASYSSFYEDKWFLDSGTSIHFTPFESNFVNITWGNYSWVKTVKLKASLFIIASSTILIEHEIFDLAKRTTKIAMSKLWLVYCITGIQIHLLSIR